MYNIHTDAKSGSEDDKSADPSPGSGSATHKKIIDVTDENDPEKY